MLDKMILVSGREMMLIYDNRGPVTLRCSEGENIIEFCNWFFSPSNLDFKSFCTACKSELEDTCPIYKVKE